MHVFKSFLSFDLKVPETDCLVFGVYYAIYLGMLWTFVAPLQEFSEVSFIALYFNVNRAVRLVAGKAIKVEALGDLAGSISEEHALNPAGYSDYVTFHSFMIHGRQSTKPINLV